MSRRCFFRCAADPGALHVPHPSFPTRRSPDPLPARLPRPGQLAVAVSHRAGLRLAQGRAILVRALVALVVLAVPIVVVVMVVMLLLVMMVVVMAMVVLVSVAVTILLLIAITT